MRSVGAQRQMAGKVVSMSLAEHRGRVYLEGIGEFWPGCVLGDGGAAHPMIIGTSHSRSTRRLQRRAQHSAR